MKKGLYFFAGAAFIVGLLVAAGSITQAQTIERLITEINPTSGYVGTEVTISGVGLESSCGSGFYCNMSVQFGEATVTNHSVPEGIISWEPTKIKVKVPSGATTTAPVVSYYYDTNGPDEGGIAAQYSLTGPTFTVNERRITGISPVRGNVGTEVTINGTGFESNCGSGHQCNMNVAFGDRMATNHTFPEVIISWTSTQIKVRVPTGATTAPIQVGYYYDSNGFDPGGVVANYVITGPTFIVGRTPIATTENANIGQAITISNPRIIYITDESAVLAADVSADSTSAFVQFGTQSGSYTEIVDAYSYRDLYLIPSSAGLQPSTKYYARIKIGNSTSEEVSFTTKASSDFAIESISPTSGPVGTEVTITGRGFGTQVTGGVVYFGKCSKDDIDRRDRSGCADIVSWSDTKIVAKPMYQSSSGAISLKKEMMGPTPKPRLVRAFENGPTFTITTPSTPGTNANTTLDYITEAYGCKYSATLRDDQTVQIKNFVSGSETDKYLYAVRSEYFSYWGRYPRCDELQFHLDHSTPLDRLTSWLNEIASKYQLTQDAPAAPTITTIQTVGGTTKNVSQGESLSFETGKPVIFSGTTVPEGLVTLYFNSEPFTDQAKADADGKWAYTLAKDLGQGLHTVQVAVQDRAGKQGDKGVPLTFALGEDVPEPNVNTSLTNTATNAASSTTENSTDWTLLYIVGLAFLAALAVAVLFRSRKPINK